MRSKEERERRRAARERHIAYMSNRYTFICLQCGRVSMILREDLELVGSPWCLWCGGNVAETDASYKRRTGRSREKVKGQGAIGRLRPFECPYCERAFRGHGSLRVHISETHYTIIGAKK